MASIVYGTGTETNQTLGDVVSHIATQLVSAFPSGQSMHAGFYRRDGATEFPTGDARFSGNDFTTAAITPALADGYVGVLSSDSLFGVDPHGTSGPGAMFGSIEDLAFGTASGAADKNTGKFLVFNDENNIAFKDLSGINEAGTGTANGESAVTTLAFTYSIMLAQTDKLEQVLKYNFGADALGKSLSDLGATEGTGTYLNADVIGVANPASSALDDVLLAA